MKDTIENLKNELLKKDRLLEKAHEVINDMAREIDVLQGEIALRDGVIEYLEAKGK